MHVLQHRVTCLAAALLGLGAAAGHAADSIALVGGRLIDGFGGTRAVGRPRPYSRWDMATTLLLRDALPIVHRFGHHREPKGAGAPIFL